jgi:hypothetical protein
MTHATNLDRAAIAGALAAPPAAQECSVETGLPGIELRCPAFPAPCSYVRIVRDGVQVAFYEAAEWQRSPDDVMQVLLAAAYGGEEPSEHSERAQRASTEQVCL